MNKPIPLSEFYKDTATKDNVHAYLVEFLKEEGMRMVFDEDITDVKAIGEAKKMIDKAFEHLDTLFAPKVVKKEQVNEAR